jgi:excinuclease ABC subunit C
MLTEKMKECSSKMDFEGAIDFRDKIEMLKKSENYILTSLTKSANFDVFTIQEVEEFIAINQTIIRNGKTIVDKNILLDSINDANLEEVLSEFLAQYYDANLVPSELLSNIELPNLGEYLSRLRGLSVDVRVPSKGIKKKIVEMGLKNIEEFLFKNLEVQKRRKQLNQDALEELAKILNLETIPHRLECYDISNISGTNNVSSMVVFENGAPAKKEYRKFKIKTVVGADDFKSMEETLRRRLARLKSGDSNFNKFPDLLVIDGGLGQLGSAEKVLKEFNFEIPVVSIAKKQEEIFISGRKTSIILDERSDARKLLQRIRDEAHRFSINYHRNVRDKTMFK